MPAEDRVGTVLADKYRLEAVLGSGGMGIVYRAVNVQVGRPVAIKLLREDLAEHPEIVERFLREARTANLVRHPNVVDVLDLGKTDRGVPFLVQELLEGEDLARYVEARGGRLSLRDVEALVLPIIDAVANAHARGVIHRDIKPENVFIATADGRRFPKLLDFGISKVQTSTRATETGVMMGTPAYMPPEQVKGARDADARSDVWAFGVLLFEVLSGRLPHPGEAPALFLAIVGEDAPRLVDVAPETPVDISRIVGRCLRRAPEGRYPTASELARDLRHALAGRELEPTHRLSAPPPVPDLVPDLVLPSSGRMPVFDDSATLHARPPASVPRSEPRVPASPPSAPRAPVSAPAVARPPASAPRVPAPAIAAMREPTPQSMPGTMLGGAPPRVAVSAQSGLRSLMEHAAPAGDGGARRLVALAIVATVSVVGMGVLSAAFHRAGGWPIARFLVSASGTLETASQGLLALVAVLFGASRVRHGMLQWEGENAGGLVGALVSAAFAAGAFFCAYELAMAG